MLRASAPASSSEARDTGQRLPFSCSAAVVSLSHKQSDASACRFPFGGAAADLRLELVLVAADSTCDRSLHPAVNNPAVGVSIESHLLRPAF